MVNADIHDDQGNWIHGQSAQTDASGNYTISGLVDGGLLGLGRWIERWLCRAVLQCNLQMGRGPTGHAQYVRVQFFPGDGREHHRHCCRDLSDAILALQVSSNVTPSVSLTLQADVNGDRRIGLAEALFVLKCAVELLP